MMPIPPDVMMEFLAMAAKLRELCAQHCAEVIVEAGRVRVHATGGGGAVPDMAGTPVTTAYGCDNGCGGRMHVDIYDVAGVEVVVLLPAVADAGEVAT